MHERQRPTTGDWAEVWLTVYRVCGNVKRAAEAAGVTRQAVYWRRDTDPVFAKAWEDALEDAHDELHGVAFDRAKESSDLLLIVLLKALKPEIYRDNVRKEVVGPHGGPVELSVTDARSELHARLAAQNERYRALSGDPEPDAGVGAEDSP